MRVIIIDSNTCREVNPLSKPLPINEYGARAIFVKLRNEAVKAWEEAEAKCRTFAIETAKEYGDAQRLHAISKGWYAGVRLSNYTRQMRTSQHVKLSALQVGSIHEAELLPNNKVRIL